jgi:acyl-CoA synthetase (AMP-forming)/AMP-acid ligase II
MSNNISNLFFIAANKFPERIAIIEKNKSITYKNLQQKVHDTSAYFIKKGIVKGDRVLVFVPMGIDLYSIVLALFNIGATAVFLDEWVNKERLQICCKIAACKGFIAPLRIRFLSFFLSETRKIPIKLSSTKTIENTIANGVDVDENDVALITFTTGSTGIPKAAKRTHQFLNYQFQALEPVMNKVDIDVSMTMLPIVLFMNLGTGKTSVIADFKVTKPASFNPSSIFEQLNKHQVQELIASPFYTLALAAYMQSKNLKLPIIKQIITGGAPVFPKDAGAISKSFPNTKFTVVYGSTEAEPISECNGHELFLEYNNLFNGLYVGDIDANCELAILPIHDEDIIALNENDFAKMMLPLNEIGEICVTANHVLKEYINNPEAIKKNKINVGGKIWHRTGDAGGVQNGKLYLYGRCKQIIHWQGKIFYPFLFESDIMNKHHVFGTIISDSNNPVVVIETQNEAALQQIKLDLMNEDKRYEDIEFMSIPQIPRDKRHHSKIDYDALTLLLKNP